MTSDDSARAAAAIATGLRDTPDRSRSRTEVISVALCAALAIVLFPRTMPLVWKLVTTPVVAFYYPLELEWREGSIWLQVLAQLDHIDIYDHTAVAFVNMNHGPLDPILKYWAARAFPEASPWNIARIFVPALPLVLIVASAIMLRPRGGRPAPALGLAVGAAAAVVMLSADGAIFLLFGRTDSTGHVLAIVTAVMIGEAIRTSSSRWCGAWSFAAGLMAGATYLTVWRSVPFLGALFGFAVLTLAAKERNVRVALGGAGAMLLGFASMIAVVVIVMFGSRLGLFYDHFYGFFFAGLPAPAEPTTWGLTAQRWEDLQTMFRLVGGLDRHLIVIAVVPVALLMSRLLVPWRLLPAWISLSYLAGASALYVLLFAALCAGFWLNMRGGSIVYLSYIYVLGWFLLCTFLAFLDRGRLVASLLASIVLVAVSIGGKPGPYLTFVRAQILANTDAARAFDFELARLRAQYRVVADTQHFFKRRFDHDLDRIDMGDGVTGAVRDHAFDAAFDRTVQSYFESLREHPPDIVVLGLVSAPPLKALVQEGYSCIVCGVIFHDRAEGFSLYARNDLPIAELKARFAPFAAPHG